jgi:hypothetical protein
MTHSRFAFAFVLALGCLGASGCGGPKIVVSGIEVYAKVWDKTVQDLGARASYEMGCPAQNLQYTLLRRSGRNPVEVGVEGCGKRALYIRPEIAGYAGSWQMSTARDSEPAVSSASGFETSPVPAANPTPE